MITSNIEWLVASGDITEEEKERLTAFHTRSASRRLPDIATARQRRVAGELNRCYQKTPGPDFPLQSQFLAVMNMLMQGGTPLPEAEEEVVRSIRETSDPDFTPLRT
jgi:hypothetical protein